MAVLCGVCLATANFVKMMVVDRWLMHNPEVTPLVALVVCLTMAITVLLAKTVGCILPITAKRLGFDPAVMASPMITTIVDACSLILYFQIAQIVLLVACFSGLLSNVINVVFDAVEGGVLYLFLLIAGQA